MRYVATPGAPFPKKMAQRYGEYLKEILPKRLGHSPTTDDIWEDARDNPKCPYRDYFTWDKDKASTNYWRVQARSLVNHIAEAVVVDGESKICRSFFPITEKAGAPKKWEPISDVQNDPDMMEQVVTMARKELNYWVDRYSIYGDLKEAARLVRKALDRIKDTETKK